MGAPDCNGKSLARTLTLPVAVLLYLLFAAPICFVGIAATDIVTMEGIVADGARFMARTGEYAVPHLHSQIYSYKPPLANWMALASFRLFGEETELSLRFPFALCTLLMGLAVMVLTSRVVGPPAALLCAVASLTSVLVLEKIHLAEWDIPLAATVGTAVAAACRNLAFEKPNGRLWVVCYFALGLAFLTKGVPAVIFFAPGLLLAIARTRRFNEVWRGAHILGVLVFAVIVAIWLVAAYREAGWAAFEQPLAEAHDKGMRWSWETLGTTFVKPLKVWAVFLPWSMLLPLSFKGKWTSEPSRRLAIASSSFLAAGVMMFMLVPAADSRYLLPLTVPLGILCGTAAGCGPGFSNLVRRRGIEVVSVLVALGAGWLAWGYDSLAPANTTSRLLLISAAVAILGLAVHVRRQPSRSSHTWLVLALAIVAWFVQVKGSEPHRAATRSLRSVATAFEVHLGSTPVVWTGPVSKDFHHSSLFFYLRRPIETFLGEDRGPAIGDFVVFFEDEHSKQIASPPFEYETLERRLHRGKEILLVRVVEDRTPVPNGSHDGA